MRSRVPKTESNTAGDTGNRMQVANKPNAAAVQCRFDGVAQESSPGQSVRPNRTGMPDQLKGGLERLSGFDLSPVRVHYNSPKPAQMGALAYAQGTEIHLGRGQERHLPHEGWHVVQQMQGRVKPTTQYKGVGINDDTGLEQEADAMGARACRPLSIPAVSEPLVQENSALGLKTVRQNRSAVIQRNIGFEFELPSCRAMEPVGPPVPGAEVGGAAAAMANNLAGYRAVPRHGPIMSGSGYRLEGEGSVAMPRIEFVTDDFAENSSGRRALQKTLNAINWVCATMEGAAQDSPQDLISSTNLKRLWHINTTIDNPHALVRGVPNITFKPQSTAGIRLDRMSHVFERLGTGAKPLNQQAGRYALAGLGVAQIGAISGNIGGALINYTNDAHNVNNDQPSAEMRSLVYLVALYIVKAHAYARRPKYIAPFMLRSDFASTFNLLPERATTFVPGNANGRTLWMTTCLEAAGLNAGNAGDRFLANIGDWNGLPLDADPNHITLQQWLDGIYNGQDLFTQTNYPVVAAQPYIESPGGLGNTMDTSNLWFGRWGQGTPAPIVEFRMMREGNRNIVSAQALDVYDYIVALNYADINALPDLTFFHNRNMERTINNG